MKNPIFKIQLTIMLAGMLTFCFTARALTGNPGFLVGVTSCSDDFVLAHTELRLGDTMNFDRAGFREAAPDHRISPVLRPSGYPQFQKVTLEAGNLKVVVADNQAYPPDHKKGYNGISELYHSAQDSNVFVPDFSGLNLEHIFNGESPLTFFEPRKHPMELYQKSESEIFLYQSPTPESKMESLLELKLVAPDYIDYTIKYVFYDEEFFPHGYVSLFYASYIHQPSDLSVYFPGLKEGESKKKSGLIQAFTPVHGEKSTHRSIEDQDEIYFAPDFSITLANHFSDYRYTQPWFAGRFHNMILGQFFHSPDLIRFSQSPDGAGEGNPAWDFYYIIPEPKTGEVYSFSGRILYKPYAGEKDLKKEYKKWLKEKKRR